MGLESSHRLWSRQRGECASIDPLRTVSRRFSFRVGPHLGARRETQNGDPIEFRGMDQGPALHLVLCVFGAFARLRLRLPRWEISVSVVTQQTARTGRAGGKTAHSFPTFPFFLFNDLHHSPSSSPSVATPVRC